MSRGRPTEKNIPTIVIYKKSETSKKHFMLVTEKNVDEIIVMKKRNSTLPDNYVIVDIGVGESFIEKYKKEYNIK
jgi:hypothetical protein